MVNKKYCNRLVDFDEIKALKDLKKQVTFLRRLRIEDDKWCEDALNWIKVGSENGEDVYSVIEIDLENKVRTYNSKIHQIPENIRNLKHLESIDLSHNQLEDLPQTIGNLPNIKTLKLRQNSLESIPKEIGKLTNLENLTLNHNKLTELPEDFKYLVKLREIDLSDNQLTGLPKGILSSKDSIESLDLANNRFTGIPEVMKDFSNLKYLNVEYNSRYATHPDFDVSNISKIKSLETFIAVSNNITELPEDIGNLKNLRNFSVRVNKIKEVPKSFNKLKNLEHINLGMNPIETIPNMNAFKNVEYFNISQANITDKKMAENLPNATNLKFDSGYYLSEFPDSLENLSESPNIELSIRDATEMNDSIGDLEAVENLKMRIPKVTKISPKFRNLSNLKSLAIHDISRVESFDNFPRNIERLQLTTKQSSLPSDITQLSKLKVLSTTGSWNLRELPDLSRMNLEVLDFRGKIQPEWGKGIPSYEENQVYPPRAIIRKKKD